MHLNVDTSRVHFENFAIQTVARLFRLLQEQFARILILISNLAMLWKCQTFKSTNAC